MKSPGLCQSHFFHSKQFKTLKIMMPEFSEARKNMVLGQIRTFKTTDNDLLDKVSLQPDYNHSAVKIEKVGS